MPALVLIRYGVFAIFVAGAVIALAAWAVRTRQVSPFSAAGRLLRGLSEPFVRPMELWLVQRGGNPQNAAWWIFGLTLAGGIVVVSGATWVEGAMVAAANGLSSGRGVIRLVFYAAGQVIMLALIVRVIGSWLGAFEYNRWVRPAYLLTDWFIRPLQKLIPPIGGFDLTPLVAWIILRWGLSLL